MFSVATIKALQVYGIAIALSMFIAVLIKVMVMLTSRVNKPAAKAAPDSPAAVAPKAVEKPILAPGIPSEVIAAISAAVSTLTGPHRILHIGESGRAWASEGRIAQHSSHQPRH